VPTPLDLGHDELGECVRWLAGSEQLWRVDVRSGIAHRVQAPTSEVPQVSCDRFDGEIGFALPRSGGGFVAGVEQQLWAVDPDGSRELILELNEQRENRFNDATCDAQGRLWAGTFSPTPGTANLYRIEPDGSSEVALGGLTISNGLGWLDGGTALAVIDTPTQRIDVVAVDIESGSLGKPETLVVINRDHGSPDGIWTDVEDGIWVALFGGGKIRRYDRTGRLDAELELPVPHVTSVCVSDDPAGELFATTARHRLDAAGRERYPLAGCVFHTNVQTAGQTTLPFQG
jgi:sugar lactone lactonase YvrE